MVSGYTHSHTLTFTHAPPPSAEQALELPCARVSVCVRVHCLCESLRVCTRVHRAAGVRREGVQHVQVEVALLQAGHGTGVGGSHVHSLAVVAGSGGLDLARYVLQLLVLLLLLCMCCVRCV